MTSDDIAYASAAELLRLYRAKEVSPVEVISSLLDRAEAMQPRLNPFTLLDREGALLAARAAGHRWQRGEPGGPLDGVPVTIKDLMLTKGFPTLRGSKLIDPNQDWSEDSPAVARLKEAGAVILGKTTTPEFGWKALGDSPLTGMTRNPWDPERTSGGSSAGAAAACAAGIGALHLGSDGAGSIRVPAAFCGVFGIKPTLGRVPAYPPSPMGLLSHHGPLTRTVYDAALMLNTIAQPDRRDPYGLPAEGCDCRDGLDDGVKGWRIAFSPTLGYARVDAEIAACVAAAARRFEALGARVDQVDAIFPSPRETLITLWGAGAARVLAPYSAEQRQVCDPGFVAIVEAGERVGGPEYVAADLERTALGKRMGEFHETYDLLLTPMMPVPALPCGQDLNDPATETHWIDWSPFSYPFNITRQPAATVPCGLTDAGLPIALQIVGPLYADARVLRAARAFEASEPVRRPPL